MSAAQRMSLLAGTLAALLMGFIVFQSTTQEVETQTINQGSSAAKQPTTYAPTNARKFAPSRMLVSNAF